MNCAVGTAPSGTPVVPAVVTEADAEVIEMENMGNVNLELYWCQPAANADVTRYEVLF